MADTSTIPRDPGTWTLANAQAAFAAPEKATVGVGDAMEYLAGRHWQNGIPWMGPGRDEAGGLSATNSARILRHFVAVPESAGVVRTRVNGSCGNQADISISPVAPGAKDEEGNAVPDKAQEAYGAEWNRDTSTWWDRVNLWGGVDITRPSGVRGMVTYASAHPSGSACLRAFFNPASLTAGAAEGSRQIPKQSSRRDALRHIEVTAPSPDRCAVYTDPDTLQRTGIFKWRENELDYAELWYARTDGTKRVTVYRKLSSGSEEVEEKVYPWGGLLPIVQCDIGTLLTEPVRRLQAAIDFGATALKRLTESHGFGLRTESNAQETGSWSASPPAGVEIPQTKQLPDGRTIYFHPDTPELGNGVIRTLVGIEHTMSIDPTTEKETVGLTTPQVHYHEPSSPDSIITAWDANTVALRDACHQGHRPSGLRKGSTAEASGDAYEQKRAGFESDVKSVAEAVDTPLAHFLTVVTVMAEWLTLTGDDAPTFAQEYSVGVQSHPSAGPVSSATQTATATLMEKKIISPEEATARVGIQDVRGERERIKADVSLATLGEQADTAKKYMEAGADAVWAWMRVGLSEKDARAAARSDGEPYLNQ